MNSKASLFLGRFNLQFMIAILGLLLLQASVVAQDDSLDDWARWRGPEGNGVAAADQKPPVKWTWATKSF